MPSLGALLDQQLREIDDDPHVEYHHSSAQHGRVTEHVRDLQRKVEAGGDDREPLSPVLTEPKPIPFRQSDRGVKEDDARNLTYIVMRGSCEALDEEAHVMTLWVDPVTQQKGLRRRMQIGMA